MEMGTGGQDREKKKGNKKTSTDETVNKSKKQGIRYGERKAGSQQSLQLYADILPLYFKKKRNIYNSNISDQNQLMSVTYSWILK